MVKGSWSTSFSDLVGDRMDSRMTPAFLAPLTGIGNTGRGGFVLGWQVTSTDMDMWNQVCLGAAEVEMHQQQLCSLLGELETGCIWESQVFRGSLKLWL